MNSLLKIENISLDLNLGYTIEEREKPQRVTLDIELEFDKIPLAAENDNHDSVICYNELAENIVDKFENKEFILIEGVCYKIYNFLKEKTRNEAKIKLTVSKLSIPSKDIAGPTSFTISE